MKKPGKARVKLHPMDVRQLVDKGEITTARVEENSLAVDRDIFDVLFPRLGLTPAEQAVYLQLYRHSFGRGLNSAQLSNTELQRLCNVSHTCIRNAFKRLLKRGCIRLLRPGRQHDANIYRVLLPHELLEYESATRVSYTNIDTTALVDRARRELPVPPYQGPIVHFRMIRPSKM